MASVAVTARVIAASEASTVNVLTFDTGGGVQAQGVVLVNQVTGASLVDTTNGAIKVNVIAGAATGSSFGSAFPSTGTAAGFKDSTGALMAAGNLDASGNLKVNVAVGAATGGTSSTYGAAFPSTGTAAGFSDGVNLVAGRITTAIPSGSAIPGLVTRPYQSTDGTNTAPIGDALARAVFSKSQQIDSGGTDATDTTNHAVRVNIVAGAAAGGTSLLDAATFTAGSTAITPTGGAYNDNPIAPLTVGQAGVVRLTASRAFHVNLRTSVGDEIGVTTVTNGTGLNVINLADQSCKGVGARGSAVPGDVNIGFPILQGARASAGLVNDTIVTDTTLVEVAADRTGRLITLPLGVLADRLATTPVTLDTLWQKPSPSVPVATSAALVPAQATGIRTELWGVMISNIATTYNEVVFTDGSGGATIGRAPAPGSGGMAPVMFPVPLGPTTAATALYCNLSVNSGTVYVTPFAIKTKL